MKKKLSVLLVTAMLVNMMAMLAVLVPAPVVAEAAGNDFQGGASDAFSALGFDTSVRPKGYNMDYTENPYGTNEMTGDQIWEFARLENGDGSHTYGDDREQDPSTGGGWGNRYVDTNDTLEIFNAIAGDFDGDGLPGEIAYVGISTKLTAGTTISTERNDVNNTRAIDLLLVDPETGRDSGTKMITDGVKLSASGHADYASEYTPFNIGYSSAYKSGFHTADYAWLNLMQVATGDFDGDGRDEIAVYSPTAGDPHVDIYRYVGTDDNWMDMDNWVVLWTHPLALAYGKTPNSVSMAVGDMNRDGIDDLAISSGLIYENFTGSGTSISISPSAGYVLWGNDEGALQSYQLLDMGGSVFSSQAARAGLAFDDVTGDGVGELIMGGSPHATAYLNESRVMATYVFDGQDLVMDSHLEYKVIDGSWTEIAAPLPDNTDNTETVWDSNNGLDEKYYSLPHMAANVAAITPAPNSNAGTDGSYIYIDSLLFRYDQGNISFSYALDEQGGLAASDSSPSTGSKWVGESFEGLSYIDLSGAPTVKPVKSVYYVENGAASAATSAGGYEQIMTTAIVFDFAESGNISGGSIYVPMNQYVSLALGGSSGANPFKARNEYDSIQLVENGGVSSKIYTPIAHIKLDMDLDTTIIEYTGKSFLTYSDPKVLAIIAAAPYFEDVDRVTGYDYAWQNTTSWAKTSGEGHGDLVAIDLEVGAFLSTEIDAFGAGVDLETSLNFTYEWERVTMESQEYTLTFETSQNEDAVAFYSIPTQHYVYDIYEPDGNGGYTKREDIISIPYQPNYQILNLDYYESIQPDYSELPPIRGVALTSTPGDPGSYPSSTSGYNVIAEWNDHPSGVSFGNGAQTQSITLTKEVEESHNFGAAFDLQMGGGLGTQSDIAQAEADITVGAQLSFNPSGGFVNVNLEGTTIEGSVTNMPLEFEDYGYYYNWKLFSYEYNGGSMGVIPVVSYIVNDVQAPPLLPDDFQQDYDKSTAEKNVLTWTYPYAEDATFLVYRNYEFAQDGGIQLVDTLTPSTNQYNLLTDDEGRKYKEYYFEDYEISPYSKYEYSIQVQRPYPQVPPLSSPSELISVISRSDSGYPNIRVTESDNFNDGNLQLYPDRTSTLTAEVTGPQGQAPNDYYATTQYQWQKLINGEWTKIVNRTSNVLTFENPGKVDEGQYRCQVNVITKSDAIAITSYTIPIAVSQAKRTTIIEDVSVATADNGGIHIQASVVNAHSDSGTIPSGTVQLQFTHKETGAEYFYPATLNSLGQIDTIINTSVASGLYNVRLYYGGSYIFLQSEYNTIYLKGDSNTYNLSAPLNVFYGDGAEITYQSVTSIDGITRVEPAYAFDFTVYAVGEPYVDVTDEDYIIQSSTKGAYTLKPETPAGTYVIYMMAAEGVAEEDAQAATTVVLPRPITLQLPDYELSQDAPSSNYLPINLKDLQIISGTWAPHQVGEDGKFTVEKDIQEDVTFYNTAGTAKNSYADAVKTSGYYSMRMDVTTFDNHAITFVDGSLVVLGATFSMEAGARAYADEDVGTLHMMGPKYFATREEIPETGASPDGVIKTTYQAGTKVTFQAVPDDGYVVYDWYVNGLSQGTTDSFFALTMPPEDNTKVEVQFTIAKNTLSFDVGGDEGGGTISIDPSIPSNSVVLSGAGHTFTAVANEGYHFDEWRYTRLGYGTSYIDDTDDTENDEDTYTYNAEGMITESTLEFYMPDVSSSIVAVFERDFYTLTLDDTSGRDGLTAWYIGSTGSDSTAGGEKIYLTSGALVKGDTVITVQPEAGFELDPSSRYATIGSKGIQNNDGTYTFTITEDTTVLGATKQGDFDFTVETYVLGNDGSLADEDIALAVTYGEFADTINPTDSNTTAGEGSTEGEVYRDILGGSDITVTESHPHYYDFLGWYVDATATTTELQRPSIIESGAKVTKDSSYKYYDGSTEYYFIAEATGTVDMGEHGAVTIRMDNDSYTLESISKDSTVRAVFKEIPQYELRLKEISSAVGEYSNVSLPEGAYKSTEQDMGYEPTIVFHEGDDIVISVVPKSGYTNSYWNTTRVRDGAVQKVRSTERSYIMSDLAESYDLEVQFSSTTYHNITWGGVSPAINGIQLSAYYSTNTVDHGGTFRFTLSGNGVALLEPTNANGTGIFANGNEFLISSSGEVTAPDGLILVTNAPSSGGATVYEIRNITSAVNITVDLGGVGIMVDGVDVSRISGEGWNFDMDTATLNITDNGDVGSSTGRVISGHYEASSVKTMTEFSIVTATGVSRLSIEDLTVENTYNHGDSGELSERILDLEFAESTPGALTFTLYVEGDNEFKYVADEGTTNHPNFWVIGNYDDLTIRGDGTMKITDMGGFIGNNGADLSFLDNVKVDMSVAMSHEQNNMLLMGETSDSDSKITLGEATAAAGVHNPTVTIHQYEGTNPNTNGLGYASVRTDIMDLYAGTFEAIIEIDAPKGGAYGWLSANALNIAGGDMSLVYTGRNDVRSPLNAVVSFNGTGSLKVNSTYAISDNVLADGISDAAINMREIPEGRHAVITHVDEDGIRNVGYAEKSESYNLQPLGDFTYLSIIGADGDMPLEPTDTGLLIKVDRWITQYEDYLEPVKQSFEFNVVPMTGGAATADGSFETLYIATGYTTAGVKVEVEHAYSNNSLEDMYTRNLEDYQHLVAAQDGNTIYLFDRDGVTDFMTLTQASEFTIVDTAYADGQTVTMDVIVETKRQTSGDGTPTAPEPNIGKLTLENAHIGALSLHALSELHLTGDNLIDTSIARTASNDAHMDTTGLAASYSLALIATEAMASLTVESYDHALDINGNLFIMGLEELTLESRSKDVVLANSAIHTYYTHEAYYDDDGAMGGFVGVDGYTYTQSFGKTPNTSVEQTSDVILSVPYVNIRPVTPTEHMMIGTTELLLDRSDDANNVLTTQYAVMPEYAVNFDDAWLTNADSSVNVDLLGTPPLTLAMITSVWQNSDIENAFTTANYSGYTSLFRDFELSNTGVVSTLTEGVYDIALRDADVANTDNVLDFTLKVVEEEEIDPSDSTAELQATPDTTIAFRGDTINFVTVTGGSVYPESYVWAVEWADDTRDVSVYPLPSLTVNADTKLAELVVNEDTAFGEVVVSVTTYIDENDPKTPDDATDDTALATDSYNFTIYPKMDSIEGSIPTMTLDGDGNYSLVQHLTGSDTVWALDEAITMINGTTADFVDAEVVWTLEDATKQNTRLEKDQATGEYTLHVAVDETGVNNTLELTVTYTHTLSGQEISDVIIINLSSDARVFYDNTNASGGAITGASYNGGTVQVPSNGLVQAGTLVTVQAAPMGENKVNSWYVNGENVVGEVGYVIDEEKSTLSFTVEARKTYNVTADYVNSNNYAISFTSPEGGEISATVGGTSIVSGSEHIKGSNVEFSLSVDSGYSLDHWIVNGVKYEEPVGTTFKGMKLAFNGIEMAYDVTVVMTASDETFELTAGANGAVNFFVNNVAMTVTGTDDGSGNTKYSVPVKTGDTIIAYATPDENFVVGEWTTGDPATVIANSGGVGAQTVVISPSTTAYGVSFVAIPEYEVSITTAGGSGGLSGVVYAGDAIADDTSATVKVIESGSLTLLAVPDEGMELKTWTVNGASYIGETNGASITLTNVTQNVIVRAEFAPIQHKVSYSAGANGTISATYFYGGDQAFTSGADINAGLPVTFTVTPNANYHVQEISVNDVAVDFSVDTNTLEATYTIAALASDVEVEAVLMANDTFAVTAPTVFTADAAAGTADGIASIDVEADGVSVDGNPVSVVIGGKAMITFTPTSADATVDPTTLISELEAVLTAAGSSAEVSVSIENNTNYVATISGVDMALDFSGIANPFVGGQRLVAVGTQEDEGGIMLVRYKGVTLSNLSQIPADAVVEITLVSQPGYRLASLTSSTGGSIGFTEVGNAAPNPSVMGNIMANTVQGSPSVTYTASLTMDQAQTIAPQFEKIGYSVTVNIVGTGIGSVTAGTLSLGPIATGNTSGSIAAGSEVVVRATPSATAELETLIVDGVAYAAGTHTIASLNDDVVITAIFNALEKQVTVNTIGDGSLGVYNGADAVTNGQSVAVGTQLLLIAQPAENNKVTSVEAGGRDLGIGAEGGNSTYKVDAGRDNNIIANFATGKVAVTWVNPTGATITVTDAGGAVLSSGDYVDVDSRINITASPTSALYSVTGITVNGNTTNGTSAAHTVTEATSITAVVDTQIAGNEPQLAIISVGGTLEVTDQNGAPVAAGVPLAAGTILTFVATPTSGYTFNDITVKGVSVGNNGTYTVSGTDGLITVIASFTPPAGTNTGGGLEIEGQYSVKLRAEGLTILTVTDSKGTKISDGDMVEGGEVLTISAVSKDADRVIKITVNGHPFVNGEDYEVYANTEIFVTDRSDEGLPYYLLDDTKIFLGFSADVNEDGYIESDEYVAPENREVFYAFNDKSFVDIAGHWGVEYIDFVTERELFLGTSPSEFSPDMQMTRAMFATVIGRLHERSYGEIESTGTNSFTDCDYELYYGKYVDWAAENGIIKGIGDNLFAPDNSITRQEMATILYRYATYLEAMPETMDGTLTYADSAEISDWAQGAALFTQTTDIITGKGEDMFAPGDNATRTEVATIIMRFVYFTLK